MNLISPSFRRKIIIVGPHVYSKRENEARVNKIREIVSSLWNSNRNDGSRVTNVSSSVTKKSSL